MLSRCYCQVQTAKVDEKNKVKYCYVQSPDGVEKRDKDMAGSLHIGLVNLPNGLKESIQLYYKSMFCTFYLCSTEESV